MTDITVEISVNGDDGYAETDGTNFSNSSSNVYIGDNGGNDYHAFFRFQNVTIPKGAVIDTAYLRVYAWGASSGTVVRTNIHLEDADSTTQPTDGSDLIGRSLGAAVAWDSIQAFSAANWYNSPSIVSILQALVNRSGWASGNDLTVHIIDDASDASAYRSIGAREGGAQYSAELKVTYTEAISVNDTIQVSESVSVVLETMPGQMSVADDLTVSESVQAAVSIEADLADSIDISELVEILIAEDVKPSRFETIEISESATVALDTIIDDLWLSPIKENAIERYYFTLTGTPDATTDVEIPISSFQARKRTGESTYLSVVVPDYTGQAAAIAARPNGEMVIELALILNGVETVREEILRVDLENIQPVKGGRNRSIILTGHKTQTFTKQIMTLSDSTYRTVTDGRITHRFAKCDPYLNPGDLVYVGDDTIIVDYVMYTVSANYKVMEIREA